MRRGFTLVELLVVVAILVILSTITVATLNSFTNAERIRSSARQVQSSLMGARDRALRFKHPVGVRFLLNTNVPGTVADSMVYIEPIEPNTGTLRLERPSINGVTASSADVTIVRATDVPWDRHARQGLLRRGARIKIPNSTSGIYYTVDYSVDANGQPTIFDRTTGVSTLALSVPYNGSAAPMPAIVAADSVSFALELSPVVMPNQEPMRLSSNVVIDLQRSTTFNFADGYWDLMFTPRGVIEGPIASFGLVYLWLRETDDVGDPAASTAKPQLICSLFTQAGNVITSDVNTTDAFQNVVPMSMNPLPPGAPSGADGFADDPYFYARSGIKAGR